MEMTQYQKNLVRMLDSMRDTFKREKRSTKRCSELNLRTSVASMCVLRGRDLIFVTRTLFAVRGVMKPFGSPSTKSRRKR